MSIQLQLLEERKLSYDSGIEIGCKPGIIRPDDILKSILVEIEELSIDDFYVKSRSFGDWNFSVYADKENILNKNHDNIVDILIKMYNQGRIRYAKVY